MKRSSVALLLTALLASACGSGGGHASTLRESLGAAGDAEGQITADAESFFSKVAYGDAVDEAHKYGTLQDAANASDAVIVANVVGVRITRTLGDNEQEQASYVGVDVKPTEVLSGSLPPFAQGSLTVEFLGSPQALAAMNKALPSDQVVLFLHQKGTGVLKVKPGAPTLDESQYFRLVSSQGLFVQTLNGVFNPVISRAAADTAGDQPITKVDASVQGERFTTLDALADYVKSVG